MSPTRTRSAYPLSRPPGPSSATGPAILESQRDGAGPAVGLDPGGDLRDIGRWPRHVHTADPGPVLRADHAPVPPEGGSGHRVRREGGQLGVDLLIDPGEQLDEGPGTGENLHDGLGELPGQRPGVGQLAHAAGRACSTSC